METGFTSGLALVSRGPIVVQHDGHVGILENGRLMCIAAPSTLSDAKLCYDAHAPSGTLSLATGALPEGCCLEEDPHVCLVPHTCMTPDVCLAPHVHSHDEGGGVASELTKLLATASCALPMSLLAPAACFPIPSTQDEHAHHDGCGHERIPHGDHYDFLVPQEDGSYLLRHAHLDAKGTAHFDDHGRLVREPGMRAAHAEALARSSSSANMPSSPSTGLRRRRKLLDIFSYESPQRGGYHALSIEPADDNPPDETEPPLGPIQLSPRPTPPQSEILASIPSKRPPQEIEEAVSVAVGGPSAVQKTVLDVLGICCPSEVPLIHRILEPLPGVLEVSVNVPAKTTTVLFDPALATELQLVKALNEARLDARLHSRGQVRPLQRYPRWNVILCGVLLAVSFVKYAFPPIKWVALGAVALGLPPILLKSLAALRNFVLDINALMTIAVGGALALGDFEEAASVVFLFAIADWLEGRTSERARCALEAVLSLAPDTAVLADTGQRVPTSDVPVGSLLSVRAGEMIPIDGVVENGSSAVDESSLTGESIPITKHAGSDVWAGTLNLGGFLRVKTTALAADSAVARLVRLVEDSQSARSASERMVQKFARFYTPAVVLAAVLIAVIPFAVGVSDPKHWLYLALVLLVVACPCALVISTPMVSVCGIAEAARNGVLIKGGAHLETLGRMKVLAMDKTGTLTEGHFRVAQVLPLDGQTDEKEVLFWLASIEALSSHPLAAAVVSYARLQGVEASTDTAGFEILPGEGVTALVQGRRVHVGNVRTAERLGWTGAVDPSILELWMSEGGTVGWLGVDEQPLAVFSVADQPRPEATQAVRDFKKAGLQVAMLTGDNVGAAMAIKSQIDSGMAVHAGLLPADKVTVLRTLKRSGVTGMVGDGINDAPALAAADVGIAMGVAGSAVAMETADMALMTNDLRQLARAVVLARSCRAKIIQNVVLSVGSKAVVLVLAFVGYAALWLAVVADVGTCLVVILNSLRVLTRAKPAPRGGVHCVAESCGIQGVGCGENAQGGEGCCSEGEGGGGVGGEGVLWRGRGGLRGGRWGGGSEEGETRS
ncbi:heavy metal atpase 2 [Klebsormidium nitens]|uniref:Heavy metal atpase 2 n=1 Tax=Klebsormidium nitens TaxID=105231 RepID=A0A1Y1HWV0_KLENI|nr:heavy metal atpase 2 [Klebsormidium nitens]|eukprot:GAQ83115.1 heavy metal atpase 2 [Klebsormidium nitens]